MGFLARILLVMAVSGVLLACSSNPPADSPKPVVKTPGTDEASRPTDEDGERAYIKQLLAQAKSAAPEKKLLLRVEAAERLLALGETAWARNLADKFPSSADIHPARADEIYARQAMVKSLIAAADGYYPLAYENINDDKLLARIDRLPRPLAQNIRRNRAEYLFGMDYFSASIAERIALGDLFSSNQRQEARANQDAIWKTLMEIPQEQIVALARITDDPIQLGWYELANLSKGNQTNLREQVEQLDRWVRSWPEHPASIELPADLQLLRQLYADQPQKIALLLPKSGPLLGAGNAITDGFMAAFYKMRETETHIPELNFYDTSSGDINSIYDQAIKDGADMVIGPISKEHITDLMLRSELPVPTLALNTIDNPTGRVPNLYQFGLGVEDESRMAAQKAWRDGHRRALLIAPNSSWGDRSVSAFSAEWKSLGGEVNQDYRFNEKSDYSAFIKQALQLEHGEARAREIRAIVGQVVYEPRRRQDIDFILLVAQPNQARQIKPMLAYHYANDIPIYGTSHVYSGQPEPKLDQDMDGVRFSTLPWFFSKNLTEKKALQQHSDTSPNLQPLYALGVDTFHLHARIKQLEQVEQAQFYGQTGTLKLNQENQIQRQQVWAEFKNGRARLLAETD